MEWDAWESPSIHNSVKPLERVFLPGAYDAVRWGRPLHRTWASVRIMPSSATLVSNALIPAVVEIDSLLGIPHGAMM